MLEIRLLQKLIREQSLNKMTLKNTQYIKQNITENRLEANDEHINIDLGDNNT